MTVDPRVELRASLRALSSADPEAVSAVEEYISTLEERLRLMSEADPFRAMVLDMTHRQAQLDVRVIGPQMEIARAKARTAELAAENEAAALKVRSEENAVRKERVQVWGKLGTAFLGAGGLAGAVVTVLAQLLGGGG